MSPTLRTRLRQEGRQHDGRAEDEEQEERADDPAEETGPFRAWNIPDVIHRSLRRGHDRRSGPEGSDDPDRQRERRTRELPDALVDHPADLRADHRELLEDRIDQALLEVGVALENERHDRREDQQQREQREEPVIRDQGGELTRPIVTELLEHGERERHRGVRSLDVVGATQHPLHDAISCCRHAACLPFLPLRANTVVGTRRGRVRPHHEHPSPRKRRATLSRLRTGCPRRHRLRRRRAVPGPREPSGGRLHLRSRGGASAARGRRRGSLGRRAADIGGDGGAHANQEHEDQERER